MARNIGFIGAGVMGEPMCRNLAQKSGCTVTAFDRSAAPIERLAAHGVSSATSVEDVVATSDIIFLALPSGRHVADVCEADGGLCALARKGQLIVDLGTSPVSLARRLSQSLALREASSPMRQLPEPARRQKMGRSASWSVPTRRRSTRFNRSLLASVARLPIVVRSGPDNWSRS